MNKLEEGKIYICHWIDAVYLEGWIAIEEANQQMKTIAHAFTVGVCIGQNDDYIALAGTVATNQKCEAVMIIPRSNIKEIGELNGTVELDYKQKD